jgi:hypothetical protein
MDLEPIAVLAVLLVLIGSLLMWGARRRTH